MRQKFVDNLMKLARDDKDLVFITGDLGYGVVEKYAESYPKQFLNVGVAEQSMISIAAGLASENKKVFVYSIANFPTLRCLEQIRNDICYHNFPVTIVAIGAGLSYSKLGYTHHAIEDIAVMRALPRLNIFSPSTDEELKFTMKEIYASNVPSYLRIGNEASWNSTEIPVQYTDFMSYQNTGTDALLITTSSLLDECQLLRPKLKDIGINVSIASVFKLKPYLEDPDILSKFNLLVTIEEHSIYGGLGSVINDFIIQNKVNLRIINIGLWEKISSTFGDLDYMRKEYEIDAESLFNRIKLEF